ncbi:hypothetical protein Sango_1890900 [Sesamum angolense]|uniref:Reverse transcriptase n=1 Tax=Sesamum angolense TaxID=2727404 RepID=A0AAE1WJ67_9LAMI|nr:hypothetical protein Sango_1890900 [Sesamum angolense]
MLLFIQDVGGLSTIMQKNFNTEACVVLKQHAPLQYAYWKDIPIDSKKKMWLAMKLHVFYLSNNDKEEILHKPPKGVSEEDWKKLIDYFESDGFQKISDRNKENHKKLKMSHTCGTKSIAQYCYGNRDPETEREPTRTATWRKTRYSNKKNDWVDQNLKKFIRLRGCGDGLKPPSKRGERINDELIKENEELRRQVEEDRQLITDNVLLAYEINHFLARKRCNKEGYIALKLDIKLFSHLVQYEETRGALQRVAVRKNVPWVSHLLFANDTPIFAKETVEVLCIQGLLQQFEEVLGLAINWQKSHYLQQQYGLRCRSKSVIFEHIKVRVWNKMQQWCISFLSQSVHSVLLKAVIQPIPSYVMSVFRIRDSLIRELESLMADFFWNHGEPKKIHWWHGNKFIVGRRRVALVSNVFITPAINTTALSPLIIILK